MWSPTDEALLAGVASGDADAVTALVRRYQGRVFGLARTLLADPVAAEDVAQETFVRMWRHAPAYDARRGSVATWLLAIARNLAVDALRARRADPVDPDVILAWQLADPDPPVADAAVRAVEARRVRAALAGLPAEQRRALVRAAYLGQTAREIGALEGVPVGTAKTRIRAATLKLRAAFAADRAEQP